MLQTNMLRFLSGLMLGNIMCTLAAWCSLAQLPLVVFPQCRCVSEDVDPFTAEPDRSAGRLIHMQKWRPSKRADRLKDIVVFFYDGPNWESDTADILDTRQLIPSWHAATRASATANATFNKKRLGTKRVNEIEEMERKGNVLEGCDATLYRAPAACVSDGGIRACH